MSQSPDQYTELGDNDRYLNNFSALGAMINRGRSFSGWERNCCFLNTGDGHFSDVSAATGLDFQDDGRAVALVDWDHDGDLDLWISNRTAPRLRFVKNNSPRDNHYLELRLQGTTCNRDAIGARVELWLSSPQTSTGDKHAPSRDAKAANSARRVGEETADLADVSGSDIPATRLTKTVHAGNSFLSQSSKWLHFGLGQSQHIDRLVVRWPGGHDETFTGILPDNRYTIVQGNGVAVRENAAARNISLRPTEPNLPSPTERSRLYLTSRIPLPQLIYRDFDGQQLSLNRGSGRAVLINLWATWCAPCVQELSELAGIQQQLRDKGVDVLALSTDRLVNVAHSDQTTPHELLARLNWPFDAGVATERAVRDLTALSHQAVFIERPLPIPTSFLVDAQRQVAVIYRGPLSAIELLRDIEALDAPSSQVSDLAFHFPGKVASGMFPLNNVSFAKSYIEGGYLEDAEHELLKHINQVAANAPYDGPPSPSLPPIPSLSTASEGHRANLDPGSRDERGRKELAEAYHLLALVKKEQGQSDAAVAALRHLVQVIPNQAEPRLTLAAALWQQNDRDGALAELNELSQQSPTDARVLSQLGGIYERFGQLQRAITYYRQALIQKPESNAIRLSLAGALQSSGQAKEAVLFYREVLRNQPKAVGAANNLAWILASHDDDTIRNPADAVRLAQHVNKLTGGAQPSVLDTLAVSLAAAGQFDDAVRTAERALELARQQERIELANKIDERLQLYRQSKPYRETP